MTDELRLCREAKVAELLGRHGRYEASGVVAVGDCCYVVFDNIPNVARVDVALSAAHDRNRLLAASGAPEVGYEDIAYEPASDRFYLLVESLPRGDGYMAQVHEYDRDFRFVGAAWLPFDLEGLGKGFEGLACVRRGGSLYLLVVCEGNDCRDGSGGRKPGRGRIQVFGRSTGGWDHAATIELPHHLPFTDFSGLAVDGDTLCVLSQESSAMWVGSVSRTAWRVADRGEIFSFPQQDDRVVYCNVEGAAWLSPTQVVVVSDKVKPKQKARCRSEEQSIHVFALPSTGAPRGGGS